MKRNYSFQVLVAIDQLLNTLLSGYADETLSARAYRNQYHKRRWMYARKLIDGIFFWEYEHCRIAYESERLRRHHPESYSIDS